MRIEASRLKNVAEQLFAAAGSTPHEAERIAHYLVEALLLATTTMMATTISSLERCGAASICSYGRSRR